MQTARFFKQCWLGLRAAAGDDAYERYLAHWREHHGQNGRKPLSRKDFFKQETERKWSGVKRCC